MKEFIATALIGGLFSLWCLGCEPIDGEDDFEDEEFSPRVTSVGFYQAESYTNQSGCNKASDKAGFTGSGFVDFGSNGTWIEFNNVDVPTAGNYTLKFRYATASGSRQCAIIINGTNVGNVAFSSTDAWVNWGLANLTKPLRAGKNTIRIQANTSSGGPNLDSMEVQTSTVDNCPNDPNKTEPGLCGCGVAETPNCGQSGIVRADDAKFVRPTNNGGPIVSPIFGYNWTSGRIEDFSDDGENYYEWPIYDHSDGNKIMDRNTPEYWDTFVDELLLARVTVISFHHRGPVIGDMNVSHLKKFIEACDRAGVRDQFKISYFEDTGMHGNNLQYSSNGATGSKLDCSSTKHREYLYLDYYKLFFKTIPRDMWYTYNGRPVISAWNALSSEMTNRQNLSDMLTYCANRFETDFGVKPLWVLQQNWFEQDSRLDNSSLVLGKHDWFCKVCNENYTYRTFKNYTAGVISPGYKNEISHIEDGETNEMKRWVNGKNQAQVAFEAGKDADLILLEGWTNLVESSGFYRSSKWTQPTEYINLVRHYSDPEPATLRFQAEGADVFYDTTSSNTFGDYSKRGIDVDRYEVRNSSGVLTDSGWYVDNIKSGEWLTYKNVELGSGTYRFTARIATSGSGKRIKLDLSGASVIELPNTQGKFQLVHLGQFNLARGKHDLRLSFLTSDGLKVDWFFMKKGN